MDGSADTSWIHWSILAFWNRQIFVLLKQCNMKLLFSHSIVSNSLWPHGVLLSMSGFPVLHYQSLLKLMSIESVIPSNYIILCHPLLLPSIFPSIRVFSSELALPIRWPKCWSFSFSPSNEYSGLLYFRIDWLDLLAVQGTLKRILQHHSSKASILQCSTIFIVQLSHPYMTTGKTVALIICSFVGKVMSLILNIWICYLSLS